MNLEAYFEEKIQKSKEYIKFLEETKKLFLKNGISRNKLVFFKPRGSDIYKTGLVRKINIPTYQMFFDEKSKVYISIVDCDSYTSDIIVDDVILYSETTKLLYEKN